MPSDMTNKLINITNAVAYQDGGIRLFDLDASEDSQISVINSLYTIGHSLIEHEVPRMTQVISGKPAYNQGLGFQWIVGGALQANYEQDSLNLSTAYTATNDASGCWDVALAAGVDCLVMVEANVVGSHIDYANTDVRVAGFYDAAIAGNPDCDVWIYEGWLSADGTDSSAGSYGATFGGTSNVPDFDGWAASIESDQKPYWDSIKSTATATGRNIRIIRTAHALVDLKDAIATSRVPGFTSMSDFFVDMVHPTEVGRYYTACVVYAYIYNDTPVGKPITTYKNEFEFYDEPTAAQALAFQTIAYESYLSRRAV